MLYLGIPHIQYIYMPGCRVSDLGHGFADLVVPFYHHEDELLVFNDQDSSEPFVAAMLFMNPWGRWSIRLW